MLVEYISIILLYFVLAVKTAEILIRISLKKKIIIIMRTTGTTFRINLNIGVCII